MKAINTPYEKRSTWMEARHREYSGRLHLHDIDFVISNEESLKIWMEHMSAQGFGLAEFKNSSEEIEIFKYGQLIWLADGRDIPAYIVVGEQKPYNYFYLIPLNKACKKLIPQPRYMSEKTYVSFLHHIRKIQPKDGELDKYSSQLPIPEERFVPNITG